MIACVAGMNSASSTETVAPSTPSAPNDTTKNSAFSGVSVQRRGVFVLLAGRSSMLAGETRAGW